MNPNLVGRVFRSESFVYALGNVYSLKPDFLAQARHMAVPEVSDIIISFSGTVGAVTGGALGKDAAKLIDNVNFVDEEEVINCSGMNLRVLEQIEFGSKQVDAADITSGSTNTTYRYNLKITFEPLKAERRRDTRVPLEHFLEGGQFLISTPSALPTGWAAVQSDQRLQVFMRVVDGRSKELKSRMTIRELAVNNSEFDYEVNGSLRCAFLSSKIATTSGSSYASISTLFSRTLETPPSLQTFMFVDRYRRYSDHLGTNDEITAATPTAVPLVTPDRRQKIGEMIDTTTLHVDFGSQTVPTSARLVVNAIKNRTPNLAALVGGCGSVADLQVAMSERGRVVDSKNTPVTQFHPTLVRRLPVRV